MTPKLTRRAPRPLAVALQEYASVTPADNARRLALVARLTDYLKAR